MNGKISELARLADKQPEPYLPSAIVPYLEPVWYLKRRADSAAWNADFGE